MKFFELAQCLEPAVPGGLSRAPYMRELISMFTTVTEDEWTTRNDPSTLPSDATLESMASRDSGFPKKLAKAICAKLNTAPFVWHMNELSLDTQELIARHIAAYGEHVDVEDFAYDVTALLVDILHTKAGLSDKTSGLLRQIRIQAAQAKYEKLLLVRSRGCAKCHTPLAITSHADARDSYDIVFLDATDQIGPDDFAVTCKPCGEKYRLTHTDDDVATLRAHNQALAASDSIDEGLAPLGLDAKIVALLTVINQLPLDQLTPESTYDAVPLQRKLDDAALVRACRDAMATYEPVVRNAAKTLEATGKLDFDLMRHQIRSAWFVMRSSAMSQYEIWRRITDWVHSQTRVDPYACGIVVAFMIQICDLFTPARQVPA